MTSASAVSRRLRALGFKPVSPSDYYRPGIRVKNVAGIGWDVVVVSDFDSARQRHEAAINVEAALIEDGFTVQRGDTIVYVRKER